MRSASLFTSLVLLVLLALAMPGQARAQSNSTGTPPGVECHTDDKGVYTCTGLSNGTGYQCVTQANGDRVCTGTNNGTGYTCTTLSTGELSCKGTSSSGGSGGISSSSGGGFVSKLTGWASGAMSAGFSSLVALLKDIVVAIISAILSLFALVIAAIPVPDFLKQYSLGALLAAAGPDVGWFLTTLKIAQGLLTIGAGYAFRLLRKFLTLFQW
ncbi:hypothetical protein [Xanthomonas sp. NCPPB 2632]|uniref:hypothetical protein n=1 Tax=Xanthomonas sp. NCPPB 2632 TaxID=3240912 RepID=UPI003518C971